MSSSSSSSSSKVARRHKYHYYRNTTLQSVVSEVADNLGFKLTEHELDAFFIDKSFAVPALSTDHAERYRNRISYFCRVRLRNPHFYDQPITIPHSYTQYIWPAICSDCRAKRPLDACDHCKYLGLIGLAEESEFKVEEHLTDYETAKRWMVYFPKIYIPCSFPRFMNILFQQTRNASESLRLCVLASQGQYGENILQQQFGMEWLYDERIWNVVSRFITGIPPEALDLFRQSPQVVANDDDKNSKRRRL